MKKLFFPFMLFVTGCGDNLNNFDPDKDPLKGVLEGTAWEYAEGAGEYEVSSSSVHGILIDFEVQDPCSVVATSTNYVEIQSPGTIGTFTLSVTQNTNVIFHLQNGVNYTVASGFIQVVRFNGNVLIGYLSADLDDNNKVMGSFLMTVCN